MSRWWRVRNTPFLLIVAKLSDIRSGEKDFSTVLTAMTKLMQDEEFLDGYRNIREIYEFILYMLYVYDMPIDKSVKPQADDKLLRKTISDTSRK